MPTTTNFGWTTPADTDLVKNGASAIRTLGSGIDTSFVDLKGGTTGQLLKKTSNTDLDFEWGSATSALTFINSTSFTSVSSVSLPADTFTATYDNYELYFQGTISSSDFLNWRGRTSGTDNTNASYSDRAFSYGRAATSALSANNSVNLGRIGTIAATSNKFKMTVFDPKASRTTVCITSFVNGSGDDFGYPILSTSFFSNTTSFDSFTFIPTTGTITGNIRVYGVALS